MKRIALITFVCLLAGLAARGEEDFSNWFRVMTDSATPSSFWEMSSSDKSVISKKLVLPMPVNELKQGLNSRFCGGQVFFIFVSPHL